MISKAEEARENKVKNMVECFIANENSWRLSDNFEKNCKERFKKNVQTNFEFSMEVKSEIDDC